ncbi:MAG: M2 family metallopeptidase [Planctomycetes bacterium]|nr:M2 family metallopeptidase [Planctomycetota bacterium]
MTSCNRPHRHHSEGPRSPDPRAESARFIAEHEARIRPLETAVARAWWDANTSGKDEDFARKEEAQNELDRALADPARFAELKRVRGLWSSPGEPRDAVRRQVDILYLQYLEKQVDPELLQRITAKANAIEKAFNVYRARVGGKEIADSEVRKALKESRDPALRKAVWEGQKGVGALVEKDLLELVRLRNEAARKLGSKSYHALQLELNEQRQEEVLALFDQIHELTRGPFQKAKAEIDAELAKGYGIRPEDLRPWHYHDPFFQEPPAVYAVDLDAAYKGVDTLKVCREFYAGIGLPVDDVLARSDLYEKEGKSPHAFCTDIDREGDVRVLANIVPNEYWMSTMLHELGHAVYSSKNIPRTLPYVLRSEAHILTTEGIAMLFEKLSKSAAWLERQGVAVPDPKAFDEVASKMARSRLLIFAAWCQVMLRFEVALYDDPGQDLNRLWWDLVERYQGLRRPEGRDAPDYASKIHIVSAPAYYHNYLMGQLFASQLHHAIAREVLRSDPRGALYSGRPEVGAFLTERVFAPGRLLSWNELTRHATGEILGAKAFAADFGR